MTDTDVDTFEGRPIHGTINNSTFNRAEQWDGAAFIQYLDAVLTTPGVAAVRWRQYTPYFNDGDPCEFGVGEFYLRPGDPLAAEGVDPERDDDEDVYDDDSDDEESGSYGDGFQDVSDLTRTWDPIKNWFVDLAVPHPGAAPLQALNDVSDHFENALREGFGDHAIITATRDGFQVEEYSHE